MILNFFEEFSCNYLHGAPHGAQDGPASLGAATVPDVWLDRWSININPKINAIIIK
ncbi:MAG: hypothetical protein ACJZ9G_12000 [Rhodospirillales bacterium]|tara:strand:+ start:2280 stop:2447 length:168 start_codon:yes stop_codon:yes gene_type:complete